MPDRTRREIACAAAEHLGSLTEQAVSASRALIGFDGFIDSIIRPVDRRRSMRAEDFEAIGTIPAFADRCAAAAGKSANIELHVVERRFGGNGPLMAGAMAQLGAAVTYVGAVGQPDAPGTLHPIYEPLAQRCRRVIAIGPPAETDALEFADGKLMLGKPANVQLVNWELLARTVGLGELTRLIEEAATLAVVNWVMLGGVESIWRGLIDHVLPGLSPRPGRRVFIDLADPAKRGDADLVRALGLLREMDRLVPVTLGLNQAEAERLAAVLGIDLYAGPGNQSLGSAMRHAAEAIRAAASLSCCVVHPREGAAGATAHESAWFEGPFTPRPRISTGAGDHFNGGFAAARALGLPLDESLAVGCGTSGAYVRDAQSPDRARLVEFLQDLPETGSSA
jgi:sugar/nucleoside kinase (ribokinase family)